jgi:hypothetical protein
MPFPSCDILSLLTPVLIVVQLKIEETSRRLRSGDLGIPPPEDRLDIYYHQIY